MQLISLNPTVLNMMIKKVNLNITSPNQKKLTLYTLN